LKKLWLKNRFVLWTGLLITWNILSLVLLILILTANHKQEYYPAVFLVFILVLGLILTLLWGKVNIWEPLRSMEKQAELFNNGIIFTELFKSLKGISPSFDELLSGLHTSLDKDRMIENAKQQARYLALQNQINPHFLYNVLESIRSDAIMAGVPEIGKITEALAVFFRYTTSNMESLTTLEEELSNVRNYFLIQKYRFEDKIDLDILLPEEEDLLKARIPKLTLQPIVENAIKHGLEPKIEGGNVIIDIDHSDTILYISVTDNGVGIDESTLEHLNDTLLHMAGCNGSVREDKKGGIALNNVNSRIRLLMGEEFGLHLFSSPDSGTEVSLTLPYILDEAERLGK
jgi:two-component system sensor histidine kinase YesM